MDKTIYYSALDYDVEYYNNRFKFLTPFERLIYLQLLEYFRDDANR